MEHVLTKWKDITITEEVQEEGETIVRYHTALGEEPPADICNCLKCGTVAKSEVVEGWLIDHPSLYERIYFSCDEYTCPECEYVWQHRIDREYTNTKQYIMSWVDEFKQIIHWITR